MSDSDDNKNRLPAFGTPTIEAASAPLADLKDHVSEAAVEAVQGTVDLGANVKDRVTQMASRARARADETARTVGETAHEVVRERQVPYEKARATANSGYRIASKQVAASPMTSLLVAGLVGLGAGWVLYGMVERERRRSFLVGLPDAIRRRNG